jgi:quercetin dioxygenase-like cupin family protein
MDDFPDFMKNPKNRVPTKNQYTQDIEGYYYEGQDGSQIAYWTSHAQRTSEAHRHDFDEYLVCVQGEYTIIIGDKETPLKPGNEFFIPRGILHSGRCLAGTRTIHAFGGKRI